MVRTTQPVRLPQPFQQPEPRGLGEGLKSCLSIAEDGVAAGLQGGATPRTTPCGCLEAYGSPTGEI